MCFQKNHNLTDKDAVFMVILLGSKHKSSKASFCEAVLHRNVFNLWNRT